MFFHFSFRNSIQNSTHDTLVSTANKSYLFGVPVFERHEVLVVFLEELLVLEVVEGEVQTVEDEVPADDVVDAYVCIVHLHVLLPVQHPHETLI